MALGPLRTRKKEIHFPAELVIQLRGRCWEKGEKMCTSSYKFIIADQLRKASACSICLNYFADVYLTLNTYNFCFICISTWERTRFSFSFFPSRLHISYVPQDSDHHSRGGWVAHISTVTTMCWLFSVYMKLGSKMWVCPRVNQAMLRDSCRLCTRCPMLHFILLLLGMEVEGEIGAVLVIWEDQQTIVRLSPCLSALQI